MCLLEHSYLHQIPRLLFVFEKVLLFAGRLAVCWDNGYEGLYSFGNDKFTVWPDEGAKCQCKVEDKVQVGYTVRRGKTVVFLKLVP